MSSVKLRAKNRPAAKLGTKNEGMAADDKLSMNGSEMKSPKTINGDRWKC